jgi:hypothetical protein
LSDTDVVIRSRYIRTGSATQFWTARLMAFFGAILMGGFSWFSLSIGDEGPEIFGKLLAGWMIGAIFGALVAMALPHAKLPFESNVGWLSLAS